MKRMVLVVLYDGVRLLDVTGPLEVFAEANEHGGDYVLRTASLGGQDIQANTGTRLGADEDLTEVDARGATVIVPGGPNWPKTITDTVLLQQIQRLSEKRSGPRQCARARSPSPQPESWTGEKQPRTGT